MSKGRGNTMINNEYQMFDERISLESLDRVFHRVIKSVHMLFLIPLLVIVIMWSQVEHGLLIGWGLWILISIYLRYNVAVSYFRSDAHEKYKWGRQFTLVSLFSGMAWSFAAFLFYVDGSVEHQVFLLSLIISLSMGSVIAGAYWISSFYVFALPIIGSMALRLLMEGTMAYTALAVFLLWYLTFAISLTKELNKLMRSEMRLRYKSVELAEALKLKTEEAQQATQAKSKFLAAASHDLRQPLHALALFFDILKESKSDVERKNIFPRIELSLDALRKLFDALLDVSRLDAEVVKPQLSHFDIAELLQSLLEEFEATAKEKKLELKIHTRSTIVVTDRLLMERILRNLISNAIRYTEVGSILLSSRIRDNMVLLQVWDTGIGIPQESQEDVFIEFQQLHNAHRDRTMGLGLGLAFVRRLCLLLNHPLQLRSQPGKGSVFSIKIPKGSASMLAQNKAAAPVHNWDIHGRRILVIDDEYDILDAMQTLLSKWGCEVITAESLSDAANKLKQNNITPDLILSDLRLCDNLTGIEAIDSLRKRFGVSIPGILITGDTEPNQIKLAKESGYEALQKPIQAAHLRSVIQHYLSGIEK